MAVTELALLETKQPSTSSTNTSSDSPRPPFPSHLLAALHNAISAQASYSRYPVALLQSHEHPSQLYILGGWSSVSTHMQDWIPSQTNQDLLKALSDEVDVKWMFHFDCDPDDVVARFAKKSRDEGGVISVGRHFVKEGMRAEFEQCWIGNVEALEPFLARGKEGRRSGWRVDWGYVAADGQDGEERKDAEVNEFVLLGAWGKVEDHTVEFVKTEEFQRYGKIRNYVEGAEIRHGKVIDFADA